MCGICGSTHVRDRETIVRMNAAMVHRGPDDEGVYLDASNGVGLGARRLSILDVAGGHQPLSNEDGTVWAALNGEIYNFPPLRERLVKAGHRLRTSTDTEVLVHLYEEYGDELVHALDGMYTFAIWDSPRRHLLLARDRFGEKPLFYATRDGQLTFASELTALQSARSEAPRVDPAAVDAYFVWGYLPGNGSMLDGVCQLPPGSILRWDAPAGEVSVNRYWSPPRLRSQVPKVGRDELVAEARELLEQSVRSRLVADVPVGVFLSGGIDSGLVAALAARHIGEQLQTFTVGYDTGSVNETTGARATAKLIGAHHHEVRLDTASVGRQVPDVLARLDQPLADQALVALHAVSALAREHVTVAVGGEGADELFGGYPRYGWIQSAERLAGVVPARLRSAATRALPASTRNRYLDRARAMVAPLSLLDRQLAWVTAHRAEARHELYGPRLEEHVASDPVSVCRAALGEAGDENPSARLMRLDQMQWLPNDVLAKADRASMLVSLEMRTPYLSRDLAEFAAGVGADVHVSGKGKEILRGVLEQVLPAASRRTPKTGFRVPAAEWLRGPLAPAFERQLEDSPLYREGWFAPSAVRNMFARHRDQGEDATNILWPLLALGFWMERFAG